MNKTYQFLKAAAIACIALFCFQSCADDDGYSMNKYWISVATVNPLDGRSYDLILDNGQKLFPAATNCPGYRPKNDQRALVNYTILSDSSSTYSHLIKVNAIENILTKAIAKDLGAAKNDSVYGVDRLKIKEAWIGDGYLNIVFLYNLGGEKQHFINLVPCNGSEKGTYNFEFRHNAYGDSETNGGEGIVSFNLSSLSIPSGETAKLNIKYNSFDGEKAISVDYKAK